jgi:hypothetical protein
MAYCEHVDRMICTHCIERGDFIYARAYDRHIGIREDLFPAEDVIEIDGNLYLDDDWSLTNLGFVYLDYRYQWVDSDNLVYCESVEEYCLHGDTVELNQDLYPDVNEDELMYPVYHEKVEYTALDRVALSEDIVYLGGLFFHPYELLLWPGAVFDRVRDFTLAQKSQDLAETKSLNEYVEKVNVFMLEVIREMQRIRDKYAPFYSEATGNDPVSFEVPDYLRYDQLSLAI